MSSIKPFYPSDPLLKFEFLIDGVNTGLDNLLKEATINFELNKIPFAKFTFISSQQTTDTKEKLPADSLTKKSDEEPTKLEFKVFFENESETTVKKITVMD